MGFFNSNSCSTYAEVCKFFAYCLYFCPSIDQQSWSVLKYIQLIEAQNCEASEALTNYGAL